MAISSYKYNDYTAKRPNTSFSGISAPFLIVKEIIVLYYKIAL